MKKLGYAILGVILVLMSLNAIGVSLDDYYKVGARLLPQKVSEGHIEANIDSIDEEYDVAPLRNRLEKIVRLLKEARNEKGDPLTRKERKVLRAEARVLRAEIERIKRVDEETQRVKSGIQGGTNWIIDRASNHSFRKGYLEFHSTFNDKQSPSEGVIFDETGLYEVDADGLINIDTRRFNRRDLQISPNGSEALRGACDYPFPHLTPCSLVFQPRNGGKDAAIQIGSQQKIKIHEPVIGDFYMNDCEVGDNGGDGWRVKVRKLD